MAFSSSSMAAAFSPPIFCVQIFLERISSPWEANFDGLPSLDVHFSQQQQQQQQQQQSFSPSQSLRLGSGRLFFIRAEANDRHRLGGWLELRGRGKNDQTTAPEWTGRLELQPLEEKGRPVQIVCQLQKQQQQTPASVELTLEAHLLLSVARVERKVETTAAEENGKRTANVEEKEVQTVEAVASKTDRGTQTTMTAKATEMPAPKNGQQSSKTVDGEQSRRALLRVLLWLLMRAKKNKTGAIRPPLCSRSTLTKVSLPPSDGTQLIRALCSRSRFETGQLRARIGYLSAVHRTLVPEPEAENKEVNKKKRALSAERATTKSAADRVRREGMISVSSRPAGGKMRDPSKEVGSIRRLGEERRKPINFDFLGAERLNKTAISQRPMPMEVREPDRLGMSKWPTQRKATRNVEEISSSSSEGLQSVAMASPASPENDIEPKKESYMERKMPVDLHLKKNGGSVGEGKKTTMNAVNDVVAFSPLSSRIPSSEEKRNSSASVAESKGKKGSSASSIVIGTGSSNNSAASSTSTLKQQKHASSTKSSTKSKSQSQASQSSSQSQSALSTQLSAAEEKSGTGSSSSTSGKRRGSGSSKSSTIIGEGSSVKTDSSVPMEIPSAISSATNSSSRIIRSEESGGGRESGTSRYLKDLRKQVLNDL